MARTTEEIFQQIVAAKNADIELSGLNSNSATAIWRLWAYITASIIHLFERLLDSFKVEIQTIIDSRRIGTLAWYVSTAKDFQLGDTLVEFASGDYGYLAIDPNKRIVSRASAKVEAGLIKLKVAKENGESAVKLSAQEEIQFRSYMELVKFAGVQIDYITLDPDLLNLDCKIYYDGIYPTAAIETTVQTAIEDFLKAIPFDGVLKKNALIEKIRKVPGVTDVEFVTIQAVQGATTTNVVREYETIAGYINLNNFTISQFIVDAI
jgi:hypothetical protein